MDKKFRYLNQKMFEKVKHIFYVGKYTGQTLEVSWMEKKNETKI